MANWLVGSVCGGVAVSAYTPVYARIRPCVRVCGMANTGSLAGILGGMLTGVGVHHAAHGECIPAVSYSPTRSLVQYHRRWKA